MLRWSRRWPIVLADPPGGEISPLSLTLDCVHSRVAHFILAAVVVVDQFVAPHVGCLVWRRKMNALGLITHVLEDLAHVCLQILASHVFWLSQIQSMTRVGVASGFEGRVRKVLF